ncbi:hypothetical protein ACHAXR_009097 [Thalassiosira sp. AJA248-18]
MKYLEDTRFTQLTSHLTGAFLNTRGSGSGGGSSSFRNNNNNNSRNNNTRGSSSSSRGKNKQHQQSASASGASSTGSPRKNNNNNNNKRSSPTPLYTYNPEGYGSSSSSSCRVIYGRVEAYTTKRAGSDKKTAFEVGERYAHEMERLNEAVEALKQKHREEAVQQQQQHHQLDDDGINNEEEEATGGGTAGKKDNNGGNDVVKNLKTQQRRGRFRSRSVDGVVTFDTTKSPRMIYDKSENTAAMSSSSSRAKMMTDTHNMMGTLEEGAVADATGEEIIMTQHTKRHLPLEGILKQPSSNKRCRATSFDISTGPSTSSSLRRYHHSESSSSLLAGTYWGSNTINRGNHMLPLSVVHPNDTSFSGNMEEDCNIRPLIPQPSLYQSSLVGEHQHPNGEKSNGKTTPTMVPRRLVTDLILTLNASFPDYDFGSAQVSDFCTLSNSEAMRRINEKLGEYAATTDEGRDFLPRFWNSLDDVLGGLKDCEVYSYAPKGSTGEDDPLEFLTMSMAENNSGGMAPANGGGSSDGIIGGGEQGGGVGAATVMFSPSGGGRIVSEEDMLSGLDTSMGLNLPNQISPASCGDPPHVTLWSMNYFFVSRNKKRIVLFACVQTMRTPQGNADDEDFDDRDEYEYGENNLVFDEARRGIGMEQEEKRGYNDSSSYQLQHMSNMIGGPSSSSNKAEFSSPGGDESVSVMVEDTDFDEGVDVDGDVDQGENDFDTGALGISVTSQVA